MNATACVPDLFRRAGVTHVAFDLTAENMRDARHRGAGERWAGFTVGGFFVSRGGDTDNEVNHVSGIAGEENLGFLLIETESHKVGYPTPGNTDGGQLVWTERLYAGLRERMGAGADITNVMFGVHQDRSVFNHDALSRHKVKGLWEAYEGAAEHNGWVDGATTGVKRTVEHVASQGWKPIGLVLGDKHLARDTAEFQDPAVNTLVGDVWVWAAEQSGEAILELAKVPA